MVAVRGTAGRIALSFAQQTSLSVLGTLAATAVVATLKSEWPPARAPMPPVAIREPALPSLTSGGKFAARAIAGGDPEPFVTLTTLPPVLPLFTAPTVPPLGTISSDAPLLLAETPMPNPAPQSEAAKSARPAVRRDMRRLAAAPTPSEGHGMAAPIVMASLPDLPAGAVEDGSLLARSKSAYRTVAFWGDTLLDHLLP